MRTLSPEERKSILASHKEWLDSNGEKGSLADLSYAILRSADMRDADLRYANLHGADLSYADLRSAILRDADLFGANLCGADMRDADLRDADLFGANLCGADMRDADLRGANIGHNTCFASCIGQPIYQASCGFGSRNATLTLYAAGAESKWLFFTGCFSGPESQLRAAIAEEYGNTPAEQQKYLLAVDYLLDIARANINS